MDKVTLEKQENFLSDAVAIVEKGRQSAYASVNQAMIATYWQLGKHIVEFEQGGAERAEYGTELIAKLSTELTAKFGKGYTARNLRNFRQFYLIFPQQEIWHTRVPNLTWSHYRHLLRVENDIAREWYLKEAAAEQWSVRTLDRNISSQYYERLLLSQRNDSVKKEMQEKTEELQEDKLEFIKNPVVTEFLGLAPNTDFTESELEGSIIMHLSQFLMELGKGYAFVARQQHIRTDAGNDYFIDLVFYNYILKCFVLIDLKTTKISYQDVGQMDMYLQIYDDERKQPDDNATIGIILCSETDGDVAKYSTLAKNDQLYASKYKLCLPTPEELKREIERQKEIFRLEKGGDNNV
jgi:predicted nuclease of restriction endonuclease-like (RecB) superfamily